MYRVSGNVYALLAALLWGSTAAVVKLIGSGINNIQILFFTSAIASISLALIVTFQKKWHTIAGYRAKDYVRFAYMAFIGVFLYYMLLYAALQLVPGQEAFVVNYTWPIWVIVFAVLILKEKLTPIKVLAIGLSFIGVYVVITRGHITSFDFSAIWGNILALIAACAYGLFSVLSKRNDDEKVTSTLFFYLFAFVYTSVYLGVFSSLPSPTPSEWLGLLWLGIATSGIAFVLWQLALKHGETSKVSNIVFITPFLSLVYLAVLAKEKILLSSVIGALLIVGGLVIQSVQSRTKRAKNKSDPSR